MAGDKTDDAATVIPPREGKITVTSLTGGTASAAIEIGGLRGQYVTIGVDDGSTSDAACPYFWVTFGGSGVTAPSPTSTSGNGRTMGPFKELAHHRTTGDVTHYRILASGSGTFYARHYASSAGS